MQRQDSDCAQVGTEALQLAREKGIRLWVEHGQLHYEAAKGSLSAADLERIRTAKEWLVSFLEDSEGHDAYPEIEARAATDSAPLTYAQLAHWNTYELGRRPSMRQIASATRIRGDLDVPSLTQALATVKNRHEALRTTFAIRAAIPAQIIELSCAVDLQAVDLSAHPPDTMDASIAGMIEELVLEPLDVARGPLFASRLAKVGISEHVLILALDHLISDDYSMSILLQELWVAYAAILAGKTVSLPAVPVQQTDLACWLAQGESSWMQARIAYWRTHLAECTRLRLPGAMRDGKRPGWDAIPVRIEPADKRALQEWCRLKRTTLPLAIYTAFALTVLRWCGVRVAAIGYQTDGRFVPGLSQTIGYCACALYLRVEIHEGDRFDELLRRVTSEYCRAYERTDFSYAQAQVPVSGYARNSMFNWIPTRTNRNGYELSAARGQLKCSPIEFVNPLRKVHDRDGEPSVLFYERDASVDGHVLFPRDRFTSEVMERFGRNLLKSIAMLRGSSDGHLDSFSIER